MKKFLLPSIAIATILLSCSKGGVEETLPPPPPPPPPVLEPIRVMQSIRTYEANSELTSDTTFFSYDDDGRVTSRVFGHGEYTETYTYTNGELKSIKLKAPNGESESLNTSAYSADGDTVVLTFVHASGNVDTVQLTYAFSENQHTDFWTYLHRIDHDCSCILEHTLQKEKFYYDAEGKLIKKTIQTPPDNEENDWYTVLAWDDKKNPKRDQPKMNALTQQLNAPLESSSLHNPTKYTDANGSTVYEVEMTYNEEGYPLTYKMKGQNFVSTELIYNR